MRKLILILLVFVSVGASAQIKSDTSAKKITMYCGIRYSVRKPLYVIDGKVTTDTLWVNKIGAQNIESINVLKDSVATSTYGDSGKNGVIIIITKNKKLNQASN